MGGQAEMPKSGGSGARSLGVSLSSPEKSAASYHNQLCIGGLSVRVVGSRGADVAFDAEHVPFRVEMNAGDIEIRVSWVQDISRMPGRKLFDSATTWRLYEHELGFRFDFGDPLSGGRPNKRLVVDQSFRHATLEMSHQYFKAYPQVADPLGYPLDELLIMHRLTHERAIELHGVGIVGPNGASNLFVGHSGAGKSTTARLWTSLHKVEILSDDRIIVRESPARELQPGDDPRQIYMYGTPWHGEGCFALPQRAPLQRIFILEHGHGNMLTRLTRSQMVAELFARAFVPFHRHEYIDSALNFLERVADSVPCYRYSFEPDERAVEKILQFND
jgi:hypothetical protein